MSHPQLDHGHRLAAVGVALVLGALTACGAPPTAAGPSSRDQPVVVPARSDPSTRAPGPLRCAEVSGDLVLGVPVDVSDRRSPRVAVPGAPVPRVTGVRSGRHDCWDRVVIDLVGPSVPGYQVTWLGAGEALHSQGRGDAVPLAGDRVLQVVLHGALFRQRSEVAEPRHPAVRETHLLPSFEGTVRLGVGVETSGARDGVTGLRVFPVLGQDARLVIDIAHGDAPQPG